MAKAKKLPSGSWNVVVYDYTDENGKRISRSFTSDTKAEALYKAAEFARNKKARKKNPVEITVEEALKKYIALSDILSPTTIDKYETAVDAGFKSIMKKKACLLTDEDMQEAINEEIKRISDRTHKQISAKTVKNEWTLISSALKRVCGLTYNVRLPKVQKKVPDLPTPEKVMEAIKDSNVELAASLALWLSFSMSEVRGLMYSDIKDDTITVNRVKVTVDGLPLVKENAKVETRLRKVALPKYILELIAKDPRYDEFIKTGKDDFIITLTERQIYGRFKKACKAYNIDMRFHDLRHLTASVMCLLNIPEKYAQEIGGWKTPHVMKSVYQHTFSDERIEMNNQINDYFTKIQNKIQNESPNPLS